MPGDLTIDELRALARSLPLDEFRRQVGPFVLVRQIFDGDGPLGDVPGRATMKLATAEIMAKAMLAAFDEQQSLVATLTSDSPDAELEVGRDGSCGFVVPDRSVSKHHAVLSWSEEGGHGQVCDLGSTNGTFVNAAQLDDEPIILEDGDVITFGDVSYTYQLTETLHATMTRSEGRAGLAPSASGASGEAQRPNGAPKPRAIGAVPLRRAPFRLVPCREPAPPTTGTPDSADKPDSDTYPPETPRRG